jgi:DNA-binding phage protein
MKDRSRNRPLTEADIMRLLRGAIEQAGGQAEWARRTGINRTHVNRVLNGHKHLGPAIWKTLNLQRIFFQNTRSLSGDEVIQLLRAEIELAGGQAEWARIKGINRPVLNGVLKGHRSIPPSIVTALTLRTALVQV